MKSSWKTFKAAAGLLVEMVNVNREAWARHAVFGVITHKYFNAGIAQLIERQFCTLNVGGLNPSTGSI